MQKHLDCFYRIYLSSIYPSIYLCTLFTHGCEKAAQEYCNISRKVQSLLQVGCLYHGWTCKKTMTFEKPWTARVAVLVVTLVDVPVADVPRTTTNTASKHTTNTPQTHPKRPLTRFPCVCNTSRYCLRGRVSRTSRVRERLLKGSPPACQQCQQCQCKLPRAPLLLPRCLWVMWLRLMWW